MRNESMYLTMYNESIQKVSNQEKIIEELKETVEQLTIEMDVYRTKIRKELMRLQKELGKQNENKQVDS